MMRRFIVRTRSRKSAIHKGHGFLLTLILSSQMVPAALALTPTEILTMCREDVPACRVLVGLEVSKLTEQVPTNDARDIALVDLAVAFASDQDLPEDLRAAIIRDLALAITTLDVSQQIVEIAATIDAGQLIETGAIGPEVVAEPVLASPN